MTASSTTTPTPTSWRLSVPLPWKPSDDCGGHYTRVTTCAPLALFDRALCGYAPGNGLGLRLADAGPEDPHRDVALHRVVGDQAERRGGAGAGERRRRQPQARA